MTEPLRIAVLDDYQGIADTVDWSPIPRPPHVTALREHIAPGPALVEALSGHEVVVAMRERTPLDASLLADLPALKLLVTTGPFNAAIDVAAARRLGITVSGTGGAVTPTVEHTWALILGLQRHLVTEDQRIRDGLWQSTVGSDLHGATLGLVGVGRIGSRVAAIGTAFGMNVIGWSPNLTEERAAEAGVIRVERDALFAGSDVVSLHMVLAGSTRGLVGATELAAMKPSAILVNTSRGGLIDESALLQALRSKQIRGAALDVYQQEPLPAGNPLAQLPNTLLTPHLGYVTETVMSIFYRDIVEDIAAYCAGSPLRLLTS
ncbi:D-2-hydroxyacid dehydrogenase family protein [Mycolicibacterium fortuitum]|jgi:phosphoglycerate dehydrogenase-like enzyme|uniref:D-3-phosphoglycerate dehydrogenase SerA2 n=4 Tax=Mycolicibacterium TaxID=1866885 RepID=A0A378UVA7_MYCFO|nr:D-2-hydroxyacid dehydrogenase family protein [Mycolicibacterium fortuitum]AIY49613.2 D-3-phosphoglycerate dehydrogenase [Mycobacterium sp. VKM Ac-1817D]CRL79054.1 D-3-phosphoglycerate dehydrogenase SerA2 [Mycolicibacter nonchromogenicus]EJZ15872.1 D-3-phosphoglycerate dehydrogenase SerA2 [Mycolicibacterium fortuitum subsp. fortuitum DSM 46621 = ATCC 6841 = JCM 6387]MCA4721797.1 D-2-hydroxyacid dehydrogenase family protein [Mycolicibacterium fortuitum]MCA4753599.1 D-2-hydroxyacid dehydrogena